MKGVGCPKCKSSHLEKEMRSFLGHNGIRFEEQQTFDWLVDDSHLFLDFFIPDFGVAVECQGIQHFEAFDVWGGEEGLKERQRHDALKRERCKEHGIEIIYFSDLKISFPYLVLKDYNQLMEAIRAKGIVDSTLWRDPELPLQFE